MSNDMKRLTAPRSWPVPRKSHVWITSPSPGPHSIEVSMPIMIIIRDMLHLCDTAAEGVKLLHAREIKVDGRVVTNHRFPVGLMDVVSIQKLGQNYRVVIDDHDKLRLVPVPTGKEAWKLCRIEKKTTLPGGKTQLNLHDGRNIIVAKDGWKSGDVVKLEVPSQKILETYKLAKGSMVLVIGGAHAGRLETVEEYIITRSSAPNLVKFKDGTVTVKQNIFVVGAKVPEISMPEASVL
jgi:small subunit ribosomal protein S4e